MRIAELTKSIARPVFRALPPQLQQVLRPDPAIRAFSDAGIEVAEKDFNHLLHHLRGQELARLPQQVPCFISVGCAGTWYFEWVQERCAPLKHIGIEFYAPKPGDLPANVEWIANTAGDMSSIASCTGDLLFSGQNIEHLWPHDITAFLQESHRVLKPGGRLVIDSPNRLITSAQNWSHPEHILEFTPAEAAEVIKAAGFEVEEVRGMWLCSDPGKGTPLPFAQLSASKPWPMARRISDAIAAPEHAFSWWIVARKAETMPDSARVADLVEQAFRAAWPDRVRRMQSKVGAPVTIDGAPWLRSKGAPGELMSGPHMPLPKGSYSVRFDVRAIDRVGSEPLVRIDVVDGGGAALASRSLAAHELANAELAFELSDTTFGLQYRVHGLNGARIECRRGVSLRDRSNNLFSAEQ